MNWTKKRKIAVLKRAREILSRRGGWIKGTWVLDHDGMPQCCLQGAVNLAARELYEDKLDAEQASVSTPEYTEAISLETFVREKGFDNVMAFNDNRKTRKKDVLRVLDEYIEVLEA